MSEIIRVAVDAMGGDNAPGEIVKGAVEAVLASEQVIVKLVGKEDIVKEELAKYEFKNYMSKKWTNVILPYLWTAVPGIVLCFLFSWIA